MKSKNNRPKHKPSQIPKGKTIKIPKPYQWYTNIKTSNTRDVSISVSI